MFGLDPGPRLDAIRESLTNLLAYGDSPMTLIQGPDDPEEMERTLRRFNRAGPLKGMLTYRNRTDQLIAELIEERRGDGNGDRDDVLAMLLEARHEDGSEMSAQELRDELMTLLVAGHETTASTLAWAFERLGREPEVLGRLTEEVRSGGDEEAYLLATIQETLRRRPVLPNCEPRFVVKPITVGGWDYEPRGQRTRRGGPPRPAAHRPIGTGATGIRVTHRRADRPVRRLPRRVVQPVGIADDPHAPTVRPVREDAQRAQPTGPADPRPPCPPRSF